MLKLFNNPANHIGQKVVYWSGSFDDVPVECHILNVTVTKDFMTIDEACERCLDMSKLQSSGYCLTCTEIIAVRFTLLPVRKDKSDSVHEEKIFTGPENVHSNWSAWRDAVRSRMLRCGSDIPPLLESLRRLEGACRDFIGMLDSGSGFSSGEKDRMNAVLCSMFVDVQNGIAVSNGSTCVQKLWSRLEAKRLRQESSREARNNWK